MRDQTPVKCKCDAEVSNTTCAVVRVAGLVDVTESIRRPLADVLHTCDTRLRLDANDEAELSNATCAVRRVEGLVDVTEDVHVAAATSACGLIMYGYV